MSWTVTFVQYKLKWNAPCRPVTETQSFGDRPIRGSSGWLAPADIKFFSFTFSPQYASNLCCKGSMSAPANIRSEEAKGHSQTHSRLLHCLHTTLFCSISTKAWSSTKKTLRNTSTFRNPSFNMHLHPLMCQAESRNIRASHQS